MQTLERQEGRQLTPTAPGGPVVAITRDWLQNLGEPGSPTRRSYKAGLRRFLFWLGNEVLGEPLALDNLPMNPDEYLSAREVKKYKEALLQGTAVEGNGERESTPKRRPTVNHRLSVIRRWVREFEDAELISPQRAAAIYHIKGVTGKNKSKRSYLNDEEIQLVLDKIGLEDLIDKRDKVLIALLAWTGLRRSEVCSLTVGQYKKANGYKIIDGIKRKGGDLDWVKIQVPLQRALEAWLQAAGLTGPEDPLFCAVDKGGRASGKPLSSNAIYLIVQRRCEAAGFEGITPHSLRRSFATNADLAGVPTSLIQAAGNWKSRAMLDTYVQQQKSLDHNATDALKYDL